jgi:hypothetical protein
MLCAMVTSRHGDSDSHFLELKALRRVARLGRMCEMRQLENKHSTMKQTLDSNDNIQPDLNGIPTVLAVIILAVVWLGIFAIYG